MKVRSFVSGRGTRVGFAVTFEPGMSRTTDSLRRSLLTILIWRWCIRVFM